jgi:hypothetical protein
MRNWAALVVVLGLSLHGSPQNGPEHEQKWDIPHLIVAGLEAYKEKGPEEAVKTWIKDSPVDGNKDALTQANLLRQVQDFYGAYQSFETISTRDLSRRVRVVYVVMNYEKGPLFAKFVTFHSEDHGWVLTSFLFNTKPELILPSTLQ